jgi:putative ABC transport system permease protein
MIRWLLTGILRDKTRSLFPFLVVTAGVGLIIALIGFLEGVFMGMIDMTAHLDTGHLRLVNRPFYEEEHLNPIDRALSGQSAFAAWLKQNSSPEIEWTPRIRWGAIIDVPDAQGETRAQTVALGIAVDLTSPHSPEWQRLALEKSLVRGGLPTRPHEILVGWLLAKDLKLQPGDTVTLIGQTFDGGLAVDNYRVSGLIRFGIFAMDKKMVISRLEDAQFTFYMEDKVTDWLGFFPRRVPFDNYQTHARDIGERLKTLKAQSPAGWAHDDDPMLLSVSDQRNIAEIYDKYLLVRRIIVSVFTLILSLVLWNAGLLNGIHRYGEMGLRLALGETQGGVVFSFACEAFLIGVFGTAAGSLLGGGVVYYLQEVGVNMGDSFAQTGLMLSDVVRGRLTAEAFIYGAVPGLTASVLGALVANVAVFRRSEANLFRELEAG